MFEQMEIFDFIENPQDLDGEEVRTALERFNPTVYCANCLCGRCVNNVEELWSTVRPEEQREPCFNCDDCWNYTGNSNHKLQRIEDCEKFEISDYAAAIRRKKFMVVR